VKTVIMIGLRGKMKMNDGVGKYKTGVASIAVHFDEKHVACNYCPYIRYESAHSRHSCLITNMWIYNPTKEIADHCLLIFEEGE